MSLYQKICEKLGSAMEENIGCTISAILIFSGFFGYKWYKYLFPTPTNGFAERHFVAYCIGTFFGSFLFSIVCFVFCLLIVAAIDDCCRPFSPRSTRNEWGYVHADNSTIPDIDKDVFTTTDGYNFVRGNETYSTPIPFSGTENVIAYEVITGKKVMLSPIRKNNVLIGAKIAKVVSTDFPALVGRGKENFVQAVLNIEQARNVKYPLLVSEKVDGVFALYYKDTIYSRTGEKFTSLEHLKPSLQNWLDTMNKRKITEDNIEIIIFESFIPDTAQPTISGSCRDSKEQHTEVIAYIHDALTLDEFMTGNTGRTYSQRYKDYYPTKSEPIPPYLKFAFQHEIYSKNALMAHANIIWNNGGEGVVARNPNSYYEPGCRNANMVKVKKGVSYDLRVVGVENGKGKFANMVGNIICEDDNGKQIRVGIGMSEDERKTWFDKPKSIIGQIVKIDALSISGKGGLREPRYKNIRKSKITADVLEV